MHELTLSEEQSMVQETVRKLVQDSVEPKALERDEHRQFADSEFGELGELGLLGMPVAEERGGAGMGMLASVVALEELGRSHGAVARLLVGQALQCAIALENLDAGADALAGIASGETLAAFVGPEHGIGAAPGGEGLTLTGSAELVTGAGRAAMLIVAAKAGDEPLLLALPADLVPREEVHALGLVSAAPARLRCEGVACESGHVLARGAEAEAALARAETAGHIGTAAQAVGSALACLDHARRHAAERIAFGKPLLAQQAVGRKLVESRRAATAAQHLTWHAARLWDAGEDAAEAARLARISAIEAQVLCSDEAIQILGGYGYTVEYHVERHYRDAQTLLVLDGGSDALRALLAPQPA